jgi:hypothetical protein
MKTLYAAMAATLAATSDTAKMVLLNLKPVETEEELKAKLDEVKARKAFVNFATVARAIGYPEYKGNSCAKNMKRAKFIVAMVEKVCGREYTALLVNEQNRHNHKVAEEHKATLEAWGYEAFPKATKEKEEKKPAERETI